MILNSFWPEIFSFFFRSLKCLRGIKTGHPQLASFDKEFAAAKEDLNLLKETPDNMVKLQMYALFKQV